MTSLYPYKSNIISLFQVRNMTWWDFFALLNHFLTIFVRNVDTIDIYVKALNYTKHFNISWTPCVNFRYHMNFYIMGKTSGLGKGSVHYVGFRWYQLLCFHFGLNHVHYNDDDILRQRSIFFIKQRIYLRNERTARSAK